MKKRKFVKKIYVNKGRIFGNKKNRTITVSYQDYYNENKEESITYNGRMLHEMRYCFKNVIATLHSKYVYER